MFHAAGKLAAKYGWLLVILWGMAVFQAAQFTPSQEQVLNAWGSSRADVPHDDGLDLLREKFPHDAWLSEILICVRRWDGLSGEDLRRLAVFGESLRLESPPNVMRVETPFDSDIAQARLISEDGRMAVIRVLLSTATHSASSRQVLGWVEKKKGELRLERETSVSLAGDVVAGVERERALLAWRGRVVLTALLILGIVGAILARSPLLWLVPVLVGATAGGFGWILAKMAAMRLGGLPPEGVLLVPLMVGALGAAAALVFVARFRRALGEGLRAREAAGTALHDVGVPISVAALAMVAICAVAPFWWDRTTGRVLVCAAPGAITAALAGLTLSPALAGLVGRLFMRASPRAPSAVAFALRRVLLTQPAIAGLVLLLGFGCWIVAWRGVLTVSADAPLFWGAGGGGTREALQRLSGHFDVRQFSAIEVLVSGSAWHGPEGQRALVDIRDTLAGMPGVSAVAVPIDDAGRKVAADPETRRLRAAMAAALAEMRAALAQVTALQARERQTIARLMEAARTLREVQQRAVAKGDRRLLFLGVPGSADWRQAARQMDEELGNLWIGVEELTRVLAEEAPRVQEQLQALTDRIEKVVAGEDLGPRAEGAETWRAQISPDGRLARIRIYPAGSPLLGATPSEAALLERIATARRLREPHAWVIPRGLGWQARALPVAGATPRHLLVVAAFMFLLLVLLRQPVSLGAAILAALSACAVGMVAVGGFSTTLVGGGAVALPVIPVAVTVIFPLSLLLGLAAGRAVRSEEMTWQTQSHGEGSRPKVGLSALDVFLCGLGLAAMFGTVAWLGMAESLQLGVAIATGILAAGSIFCAGLTLPLAACAVRWAHRRAVAGAPTPAHAPGPSPE